MSFDVAPGTPPMPVIPDLSGRLYASEWMDEPCSYDDLRSCLLNLARINRVMLAYRPTLRWLAGFRCLRTLSRPLRIVDVGCGGGDVLRRIERWARRESLSVSLTGIDMNPLAIRAAREFTPAASRIRWVVGDACFLDAASQPIDFVISSLLTHHLPDEGIVDFVRWMERTSQQGWFINDLYRSRLAYLGFSLLAQVARWHPFIRHDGPVSIARAFRPGEWRRYMADAGLPLHAIHIQAQWPGRLCVARMKEL